ncbi:hypothetical protein ACN4EG_23100 [Alkalinema pantanalense CENA528]|uniref:hypothetical protein n=1 Tax=Alkalinema pantanalense TaxID=1620705 RepID=UPI003D6DC517
MDTLSQYWTLLRLKSDGTYQPKVLPAAQAFFIQQFPESIDNATILAQLLTHPDPQAQWCLRCYVSQEIVQACLSLVRQFGENYQFQLSDLLPLVLDDDGRAPYPPENSPYKPLAIAILERFRTESGSLHNWIVRLVRQHPALQQFLLNQGLHLITPWAILNDTSPDSLERILREFYQLSVPEIEFAVILLNSYHAVYLYDRQHQKGRRRCEDPTDLQLQRIAELIEKSIHQTFTPEKILDRLKKIADQLRQYRIHRRGGQVRQRNFHQSFDTTDTAEQLEYQISQTQSVEEDDDSIANFLQAFRQEFSQALEQSLQQVIHDRLQKKPKTAQQFLQALEQIHCQRCSMGEIAPTIGLKRQDEVTRLLKLKAFRADVRNLILHQLKTFMQEKGPFFIDPDRLVQVAKSIDAALEAQVDDLITAAQKEVSTAKGYTITPSLFTQKLCTYLHRIMTVP